MINERLKYEKRDRFDEYMRARHEGAVMGLRIEEALSSVDSSIQEDDYPTSMSPDNVLIRRKAEEIAQGFFKDKYVNKKTSVIDAISYYIKAKVEADRFQVELRQRMEENEFDESSTDAGEYVFHLKTGTFPKDAVMLEKREGYVVIIFYDNEDYLKFRDAKKEAGGGGAYHRAMHFPTIGQADFILIPQDLQDNIGDTVKHERQHFINGNLLTDFMFTENATFSDTQKVKPKEFPALSMAIKDIFGRGDQFMRGVKDELLACMREPGRSLFDATIFWDLKQYDYLRDNSTKEEQQEMKLLLDKISEELIELSGLFVSDKARCLLVYHLIDIPLIKFPERVAAIGRFYKERMERVLKYTPTDRLTEIIKEGRQRDRLEALSREIVGESYSVENYALGLAGDSLQEQDKEIDKIEQKLQKLRAEYDELSGKALAENPK